MKPTDPPTLPRLPSREEMLAWLQGKRATMTPPSAEFDITQNLDSGNVDPACPVAAYLRAYYHVPVEALTWDAYRLLFNGQTFVLSRLESPRAIGWMLALQMTYEAIDPELPGGNNVWTRDELIDVLKSWENPDNAASRLEHARGRTTTRAE